MKSYSNQPENAHLTATEKLRAPPLDPELAEPLARVRASIPASLTADLIPKSRELSEAGRLSDEQIRRGGAFDILEVSIPGGLGSGEVNVIICRPTTTDGPHGVIYNTHGGGMVAGNHKTVELAGELRRAEQIQFAVVAVDYRLAPEFPHPIPVEDCYAALQWLGANAAELNLDPTRIIISGNSAGGALATAVALMSRDRQGVQIIGQMLQCPMLDDRCNSISCHQMEGIGLWDRTCNITGWTALLGSHRGNDDVSCYAAPARATDLSGLPPAFIDVGAVEALRDEVIEYASRIWQAGGEAELHVWSGAFHSFDQWVPDAKVSRAAEAMRMSWLRRLLGISQPEI
jgi:acetyl esterase/lipase